MKLGDVAAAVGKGLFAGFAATAVMSLSMEADRRLRKLPRNMAAADAVTKIMDIHPANEDARMRMSQVVHFAYGSGWGVVRGLLDLAGCRGMCGTAAHFAAVSGTAYIMLPALKLAPPITKWPFPDLAMNTFHNMLYAVITGVAYDHLK